MTTNTLITIIDDVSKYYIQVRAAVSSVCRATGLWSEWSQPIYVGEYLLFILKQVALLVVVTDPPGKWTCSLLSLEMLSLSLLCLILSVGLLPF